VATHYSPKVTANNLVLYYDVSNSKCWSGSGTPKDLSKLGNDVTSNVGTVGSTTKGGALCWEFNATNKYFYSAFSEGQPTTNATLEAWIYPETEVISGDRGTIILLTGGNQCYMSWNKSNRELSNYWYGKSPAGYHETAAPMDRDAWHHLCSVWDNVNGTLYQYVDGVKTSTSTVGTSTTNTGMRIGMEGTARQFSGGIAVVKMYNSALTENEVLQSYNALRPRFGL